MAVFDFDMKFPRDFLNILNYVLTFRADRGILPSGIHIRGRGGGGSAYIFPIYLQTILRNYTKFKLCARILLQKIFA